MAANRRTGFPMSEAQLRKMGGMGLRFDFLKMLALRNNAGLIAPQYDFQIKAVDTTNLWTVAAGATATTWAVRAEPGGWIRGVTGTTAATSGLQLSIPQKYWNGDVGSLLLCLLKISAITEIRVEVGFADALPSVNTTVVNSLSTPSFNTTAAAAAFVYDHTGSTTTMGLYGIGTAVAANKTAVTAPVPVADTLYPVCVQLVTNKAFLYLGDSDTPVASVDIEGGDGLIPFVSVKGSNTSSKNVDIDLFLPQSGRLG